MAQDGIKEVVASGDFTRFVAEVGCDTPEKALPWGACWQPCAPRPAPPPPSVTTAVCCLSSVLTLIFRADANLMVHQLCAAAHRSVPSFNESSLRRCYEDDAWALATAKHRLATHFPVVGVLERLDETLELLDFCFDATEFGAAKKNGVHSMVSAAKFKPNEEEVAAIRAANRLDTALYAFGVGLFEQQLAAMRAARGGG